MDKSLENYFTGPGSWFFEGLTLDLDIIRIARHVCVEHAS